MTSDTRSTPARILVLQHLAVEHPGVFRDLWRSDGHPWTTVELDDSEPIPPLEGYDLMVAMGGPMDVWEEERLPWLAAEKQAIRRWVRDLDRPFLGICLGHQLLAAALGGEVAPMTGPEVGIAAVDLKAAGDDLLRGLASPLETFQWHGAEVVSLPQDAVVLASNAACAVQAMKVGRHAFGLQFHCELTSTTVADWNAIPAYRASLEAALGDAAAADLEAMVAARLDGFADTARCLHDNLMRIVTREMTRRVDV